MNRSCLVSSAIRVRRCIYQVPNCSSPVVASTTRAFKSWIGSGTELGNRLHSIEYPAIPLPGVGSRAGLQRTVTQVSLDVSPIWWALLKTLAGSSGIGVSKNTRNSDACRKCPLGSCTHKSTAFGPSPADNVYASGRDDIQPGLSDDGSTLERSVISH